MDAIAAVTRPNQDSLVRYGVEQTSATQAGVLRTEVMLAVAGCRPGARRSGPSSVVEWALATGSAGAIEWIEAGGSQPANPGDNRQPVGAHATRCR
jgi:hypothetical protein